MPQTHKIGIVSASALNVRPDPSTRKPAIGKLARKTTVDILERVDGWFKVKTLQIEGYVHGDYITIKETDPSSGFLYEREELKAVPLEPPTSEKITVRPNFSRREKVVARTWNTQGKLLQTLSGIIDVDQAAAVAVLCVESGGRGFSADGSMIIRFENHIFWRQWGKNHQDKFNTHFTSNPEQHWKDHKFRQNPTGKWTTFHGDQVGEWRVFEFARRLSEPAAMRSISMGGPQIMGFNHARIGYDSVLQMFEAFNSNIRYQTLGLFDFIQGPGSVSAMVIALQRKKFEQFATEYNGPGQAAVYAGLIEQHYEIFNNLNA